MLGSLNILRACNEESQERGGVLNRGGKEWCGHCGAWGSLTKSGEVGEAIEAVTNVVNVSNVSNSEVW